MSAVETYETSCDQAGIKPRSYLVQTLESVKVDKNSLGEHFKAGVINLRGTAKTLFKNRLTDKDVVAFIDGLSAFGKHSFQAVALDLSCNNIGSVGVKKVCDFLLQHSVQIHTLNLSENDIDADGIQSVVELVKENTHLSSLDVHSNDVGPKGMMNLVLALESNKTLSHINIGQTGLDASAIIALCDMLKHRRNATLQSLGLSTPYVSKRSVPCNTVMEQIGLMLKHNKGIISLDLTGHRIDDQGAEILCTYLRTCGSVKNLILKKNYIGFKGAAAFAAVLIEKNCSLVDLDLSRNNIDDDGGVSIAKGLARNVTVQTLDLSDNNIKDEGLLQLQQSATRHGSLRSMRLFSGNHFGIRAAKYAHHNPLDVEAQGNIAIDYCSFVVDDVVQIARKDMM